MVDANNNKNKTATYLHMWCKSQHCIEGMGSLVHMHPLL